MWGNPHFLFLEAMENETLKTRITGIVEQSGAHVVELAMGYHRHNLSIDVYADTRQGVTMDELTALTRSIQKGLADIIEPEAQYHLTVSSPGLDRPLKFGWQYMRHAGRKIRIDYNSEGSAVTATGKLLGEENGIVKVEVGQDVLEIGLDSIVTAKIALQ
jgi:ribosome maturation factor RimP